MGVKIISEISQKLTDIGQRSLFYAAVAMLVFGLINCFLGYKLLKLWVTVLGFAAGSVLGFFGVKQFVTDQILAASVVALIAGVVIALIAYRIYLAGIFIVCWTVGFSLCNLLLQPKSSAPFFLCLLVGFGIGVLGVKFVGPVVILTTGIQGGIFSGVSLGTIFGIGEIGVQLAAGIVIAVLGVTFQFLTCQKQLSRERDEENDEDEDE